jgi:hypothetical protein
MPNIDFSGTTLERGQRTGRRCHAAERGHVVTPAIHDRRVLRVLTSFGTVLSHVRRDAATRAAPPTSDDKGFRTISGTVQMDPVRSTLIERQPLRFIRDRRTPLERDQAYIVESRAQTDASLGAERASTDVVVDLAMNNAQRVQDDVIERDRIFADERLLKYRNRTDSLRALKRATSLAQESAVAMEREVADGAPRPSVRILTPSSTGSGSARTISSRSRDMRTRTKVLNCSRAVRRPTSTLPWSGATSTLPSRRWARRATRSHWRKVAGRAPATCSPW